jgi:hypothetical protein
MPNDKNSENNMPLLNINSNSSNALSSPLSTHKFPSMDPIPVLFSKDKWIGSVKSKRKSDKLPDKPKRNLKNNVHSNPKFHPSPTPF